jgi:hypothetical protein
VLSAEVAALRTAAIRRMIAAIGAALRTATVR